MSSTSWTSAETPSVVGSSILREDPPFSSAKRSTEHGGEDLSLSELCLDSYDSQSRPEREEPFSLLPGGRNIVENDSLADGTNLFTSETKPSEATDASGKHPATTSRRDRLQRDLFVLKRLNASMSAYITALGGVSTATEVRQTPTPCVISSFKSQ